MNDPPMQATPDEIVTEAMVEAGVTEYRATYTSSTRDEMRRQVVTAIYLAMRKARAALQSKG